MPKSAIDPRRSGVLLIDLQNDVLHPEGAYVRGGVREPEIDALPGVLAPLCDVVREASGWIVSTHFTLVPGKKGEPFISEQYRRLRPFLGKGDFCPGTSGHELYGTLAPSDLQVEKIAYSAFFMTRLEWVLWQAKVDTLFVGGITTNVSVATTVRDAMLRDFKVYVLSDGCASFNAEAHRTALKDLATLTQVLSCEEAADLFR